jgi:glycosyltransferase involved in cell wall biosynthesis
VARAEKGGDVVRLRTTVIIPAFNEERSIAMVLDEIPREYAGEVVVVDNASTDRTAEVARAHGATVLREGERGYGAACLRGIAHTGADTDVVVILDGDHSDYPEDLPALLEPIEEDHADFVIGSRVLGSREPGALPWNQRWGNALACALMRILFGRRFTDMGPFRAIRRSALLAFDMEDRTFGWNVEMQAKALIAGTRVCEVPVRYRKRIGESKISGTVTGTIKAGTKIIGTIFKYYPAYARTRRAGRRRR